MILLAFVGPYIYLNTNIIFKILYLKKKPKNSLVSRFESILDTLASYTFTSLLSIDGNPLLMSEFLFILNALATAIAFDAEVDGNWGNKDFEPVNKSLSLNGNANAFKASKFILLK